MGCLVSNPHGKEGEQPPQSPKGKLQKEGTGQRERNGDEDGDGAYQVGIPAAPADDPYSADINMVNSTTPKKNNNNRKSTSAISSSSSSSLRTRFHLSRTLGKPTKMIDEETRAREAFARAKKKKHGTISVGEARKIMFKLNMAISRSKMSELFKAHDKDGDRRMNEEEFIVLFQKISSKPSCLQDLFTRANTSNSGTLNSKELKDFLLEDTGGDVSANISATSAQELIARYGDGKNDALHFEQFRAMMVDSDTNNLGEPKKLFSVYQDMTQPLSHYYVNSSHNSYLMGGQLNGIASDKAIERVLKLGVRVLELDTWNGDKGYPIVTHGHTFIKPVSFEACVKTIKKLAFSVSPYPLILTIENHCDSDQKQKLGKILQKQLGSMLFVSPLPPSEDKLVGPNEWLSPEDLKHRVLIRDKPRQEKKSGTQKGIRKRLSLGGMTAKTSNGTKTGTEKMESLSPPPPPPPSSSSSSRPQLATKANSSSTISEGHSSRSGADALGIDDSTKVNVNISNSPGETRSEGEQGNDSDDNLVGTEDEEEEDEEDDGLELEEIAEEGTEGAKGGQIPAKKAFGTESSARSLMRQGSLLFPSEEEQQSESEDVAHEGADNVQTTHHHAHGGRSIFPKTDVDWASLVYLKNVKLKIIVNSTNVTLSNESSRRGSSQYSSSQLPASEATTDTSFSNSAYASFSSASVSASSRSSFAGTSRTGGKRGKRSSLVPRGTTSAGNILIREQPWRSSSSIGEKRMLALTKPGERCAAMSTYTKRHIVRAFPKGSRIDSSNYDPTAAWNAGIQVAALNYQTNGRAIWLSQAKFSDNGCAGYVLKSDAMLHATDVGTTAAAPVEPGSSVSYWDLTSRLEPRVVMHVTIISGHYLPKPLGVDTNKSEVIDPYVEIHFHGAPIDALQAENKATGKQNSKRNVNISEQCHVAKKTAFVRDNGYNPEWNETFSFPLHYPEAAHLLFVVKDYDIISSDDFIGQAGYPVGVMRAGHRVVPIRHADCTPIDSAYLFVKVDFERM